MSILEMEFDVEEYAAVRDKEGMEIGMKKGMGIMAELLRNGLSIEEAIAKVESMYWK